MAKFKPKDAEYPRTYFVGGAAIRLGPDDVYETDDAALIGQLEEHGQFEAVSGKAAKAAPPPAEEEAEAEVVEDEPGDYDEHTKAELEDFARIRGIYDDIEGTGAGGGITKADLIEALEDDDR